ncbi:MAG: restriction endonuclease subunit S [Sulfurospirillum sp.]|nr:restriction endonuclease subunit S [Sulfurospirillum sp.]
MSELPSGWRETILGEVATIINGGTPSTKNISYWGDDISWITPKDLSRQKTKYINKGEKSITTIGLEKSSARLLPRNTILFTSRAPIGYVTIAKQKLTTNQGFKNIITDEINTHFIFMYYWLINNAPYIEKQSSGSTFSEASTSLMKSLNIKLPSIKEQKAIANILSSFDNKIELLKEQNRTLETLSQTIFKEWFVDFNYPNATGEMIHSEIGNIPKGWRVGKVKDIVNIYDSKRIPLSAREREQIKGIYPYHGATKIMDYIDKYIFDGTYLLLAEDGSVIDDNGYPILQYVWGKFWVNNHTHILQGKNGFSTELLYVLFKKSKVASIVNGAVQLKINQTNLLKYCVLIANDVVLSNFNNLIKPIFKKIKNNSSQIQTLQKTRDTLLPKLMSGKLRVKGFEDD